MASPMADSFVHIAWSAGISSLTSSGTERVLRQDQSYQCNNNHIIIEANVRLAQTSCDKSSYHRYDSQRKEDCM